LSRENGKKWGGRAGEKKTRPEEAVLNDGHHHCEKGIGRLIEGGEMAAQPTYANARQL